MKYLGHVVSSGKLSIDCNKVAAVSSWEPPADVMRLPSRSSARFGSTGVVLTDSSVQSAMAKVVNRTRKVAKTTPMPAQESWSHQGSLGLVSLVGGSPTRASAMSCDSVTALWSVDGATLGGWSIIPALPA